MVRLSAAESSLTVYSGRFARSGAAAWRGVPVIAAYDTRPRGDREIGVAEAWCRCGECYRFHHPGKRQRPSRPGAAALRGAETPAKKRSDGPPETYKSRPEWTIWPRDPLHLRYGTGPSRAPILRHRRTIAAIAGGSAERFRPPAAIPG